MLSNIAKRLFSILLRESANLRLWQYKRLYPGLGVDSSAHINNNGGELIFGENVNILEQAVIELPKDARVRLGSNTFIARSSMLHPSPQQEIVLGEYATVQERGLLTGNVIIGRYCIIAPNFYASSGNHFFDIVPEMTIRDQDTLVFTEHEYSHLRAGEPIVIEEDCWIGINVSVMGGVTIGKGSIVGANSVVTKDIPPYSVAVGSPAKVIKQRLNFVPPSALDWKEISHRPYFYSGFCVDNASLQKHLVGIAGYADCTISLTAPSEPSELCIEAAPLLPKTSLEIGGIRHLLESDKATYRYKIENVGITLFSLKIYSESSDIHSEEPAFLMMRAWFEPLPV